MMQGNQWARCSRLLYYKGIALRFEDDDGSVLRFGARA